MQNPTSSYTGAPAAGALAGYDEGLRQHMLSVYNYMAGGVALTGLIAYLIGTNTALMTLIFGTPLVWVAMLAPLAFVLVLSFGINRLSDGAAQVLYWTYCAVMGLSMATIFMTYTHASVAKVFFMTAAVFAGMSLYGYTTKRDLTGIGSFLLMGLFGIVLASVVNVFLRAPALDFAVSFLGILIFVGLTAYDTQKIKEAYLSGFAGTKSAIVGALELYLDFVNLLLHLLRFLGNRN